MDQRQAACNDELSHKPSLASRLKLLCVTPAEPSWTALALRLSDHGCHEPQFRWRADSAAALAAMREESFDCILLDCSHGEPVSAEAVAFLSAAAASGSTDPLLLILPAADADLLASLGAFECEALVCGSGLQSRALPVWIARAVERTHRLREIARLSSSEQRRTLRERGETDALLEQQRRIVHDRVQRSAFADVPGVDAIEPHDDAHRDLPPQVAAYYEELLRTTVMMGAGSLSDEVGRLARLLVAAGMSPRNALRLHLERVEDLIRGLGSRSSRHVMSRADMLAMELMIQIGECWRSRSQRTGLGDYGIDLLHEQVLRDKSD